MARNFYSGILGSAMNDFFQILIQYIFVLPSKGSPLDVGGMLPDSNSRNMKNASRIVMP